MRIISRFRGFYDRIQRTGQDSELLFLREPKTLAGAIRPERSVRGVESGVVIFCEQAHPFLALTADGLRRRAGAGSAIPAASDQDPAAAKGFDRRGFCREPA